MDVTWFLTAISLIGTVLNIRKNILCFYIWFVGDVLWFTFDFTQGTYGRSILDFVQVILAVCGIFSWKKDNSERGGRNGNRKNRNFKTKPSKV